MGSVFLFSSEGGRMHEAHQITSTRTGTDGASIAICACGWDHPIGGDDRPMTTHGITGKGFVPLVILDDGTVTTDAVC
jgi:hypothetical protein